MAMSALAYEPLDAALDMLSPYGPGLANGNFNHAPMVAEALCSLRRPDAVLPWVERYRDRLLPRAPLGEPIAAAEWRAVLGQRDRFAAWSQFFRAELDAAAWPEVLDRWLARLAPGVSAAATHGAIRVGHAVRALGVGETPQRRRELADGLASWAISYRELPASDGAAAKLPPREAIGRVTTLPERRPPGSITAALASLYDLPGFAPAIGLIDVTGDADRLLAELTELFARVYLANVDSIFTAIVFIHGVTSVTALGHIAPHVGDATARALLRYGWQAGCGLYACFGGAGFAAEVPPGEMDRESLIDRAIANGDEHVIKLTEACLYRDGLAPSPVYRAAAAGAIRTIDRR
jgi:hypothetical protein